MSAAPRRTNAVGRYALAVGLTGAALVAHVALVTDVQHQLPFATFYIAVVLTAFLAGPGPTVTAVVLGYLVADWFFIEPLHSVVPHSGADWVRAGAYFAVCGIIIVGSARISRARDRAEASREELEREIGERKRANDEIRAERDFNSAVLDTTASLIVVLDTDGNIVRFSRACERLTGWSATDVRGRSVFELFIPDRDLHGTLEVFSHLRKGDFPNQHTNAWRMRDGSERLIDWCNTAIVDEEGRVRFVIATGTDITESERAQKAVLDSEERLRALMAASSDALYRMSPDWREMRQLNAERSFLADTNEPTTNWLEKYIHPDDQPRVVAAIGEAIRTQTTFELEHRVIRPDGTLGWTYSRAIPVKDANGTIIEWFGAASDVTTRKRAEEALREADQRKDEFLAVLSHELRNPLAPIRNAVYVLGRTKAGSEQAERARTIIARQVDHLTRLVEDLLEVQRIASGKMRLRTGLVDVVQQVRETVEDLRPTFARHGVGLEFHAVPESLHVDGDRTRIAQVVGNLLHNASKFTDPGGLVTVTVEKQGDQAVIRVRDTGIGIAPDVVDQVFEPFVQGETTLDRGRGGLGLGLALVRGIVDLHRGTVTVHSEGLGKGTEFVVALPAAAEPASLPREQPVPRAATPKRRVLVIEDNRDAAESLRDLLEIMGGHEVQVARDGPSGVEAARQNPPDVVVCDLGLPGIDGYEVARRVRADGRAAHARLVALSGYASREDIERSLRAGFDFHVAKPPDAERLLALVAEASAGAQRGLPLELATGQHELDSQHASILIEAAKLRAGLAAADTWESLRSLERHAAADFDYEEEAMEDLHYPELASHREQHRKFLDELRRLEERVRGVPTAENVRAVAEAVGEWLPDHILDEDRRFTEFIRARRREASGPSVT